MGENGQSPRLVMFVGHFFQPRLSGRILAQEQHGGFAECPLQVGIADLAAAGAIAFTGRFALAEAIRQLLDTRIGTPFDPLVWEGDLQRLRNTELFYDVRGEVLAEQPLHSGRTVSLLPRAVFGRVDREEFHVWGSEWTLQAEIAHEAIGSEFDFIRAEVRWLGAWLPTPTWNLVAQAQLGTKSGRKVQHKT